ncbi:hypothetical protein [Emticicia agri]|uniref:Uncharacterized protein n=1 Tax=Emticicia agri TaxID=2492393 RepID=A0A4Q5LV33_9BACT|nr:hypothetical protein [Emticicia agri]RYU93576.1 hypothetical protein EWM59_21250 [Emticicia agri]
MNSLRLLKEEVVNILLKYQVIHVSMTDDSTTDSLTIILDHQTHSSKIKKLIDSFKAKKIPCQCSFCPDSWELSLTVSV